MLPLLRSFRPKRQGLRQKICDTNALGRVGLLGPVRESERMLSFFTIQADTIGLSEFVSLALLSITHNAQPIGNTPIVLLDREDVREEGNSEMTRGGPPWVSHSFLMSKPSKTEFSILVGVETLNCDPMPRCVLALDPLANPRCTLGES